MAAPYNPPVKNEDFIVRIALADMNTPGSFKSSATIAAGDFKVDKDGGGLTNLGTLPSVDPASSVLVKITLSSTEMNADVVTLVCVDQTAPKEWCDFVLCIQTSSASAGSAPTVQEIVDGVWDEARASHADSGSFGEGAASVQGNVTGSVGSVTGAVGSVTGAVGSVTGAVGSVTGAVGSVTGAVGSVTGSVGSVATGGITTASFAAGAIDAAAIAANAIGASELAADAVTEIQSGLATAAALQTVDDNVDAILADTGTDGVVVASINANAITATSIATDAITAAKIAPDAIGASELAADAVTEIQSGLATAAALTTVDDFLETEVAAILAAVDTEVAAIKAKTDLIPGTQDGKTFAETVLLMAAALLGKASGLGSTTAIYRSLDDAHDRITATVDSDGNRTAVTLDASSP
jgi:hypothetical protein